jgi:hypothetical protein
VLTAAFVCAAVLVGCSPSPIPPGAASSSLAPTSAPVPAPSTNTETARPSTETAAATETVKPTLLSFSTRRVLADTKAIEGFGVRVPGSKAERKAAAYVARRLRGMGYSVTIEKFPTPGGTSRNVTAIVRGADRRRLVLSGHLDTRSTTKGANDNALGCAFVLEMARIFRDEKPPVTLELTAFGAEEYNDGTPRDHHRGSRYHVAHLSKAERKRILGMISVDVVGYGPRLYTRTMGIGPKSMSDYLLARAAKSKIPLSYNKDPGPTGWSDHEPYEKAGIPAVWLERLQDPQYHRMGDTASHLQRPAVRETGRLVLGAIRKLRPASIATLARR